MLLLVAVIFIYYNQQTGLCSRQGGEGESIKDMFM